MKKLLSFPKMMVLGLIRRPQLLIGIGLIFLILLIWIGGPSIGLESSETRWLIIAGILFLWILFVLLERFRIVKGARMLEESLQKQAQEQMASARPDRKEEVDALRVQFEKAVGALKGSKLGKGRRGASALYALPWYMFIGPPASGKSTALLHSGLQFPYLAGSGKGVQGVGGTRNCDWWFTSDAVLLDTAGRYVTEDEDREEWFGFLDLLKKNRGRTPVNGVLAAISIADLLQASDEEIEWHAKNMRERIDELIQRLGIVFPVYLFFTKCDLIRGFVEFFEDLGRAEREQIWGATIPRERSTVEDPAAIFDEEFSTLVQSLNTRRIERLSSARGSKKIRDVYGFPLQLSSGREKLAQFVEVLFQRNPYQENPVFRGFYMTSGTQEGTPIDRILAAVGRASGLPEGISESLEGEKESKSYFIKDLFTKVIFPDQDLAVPTSAMVKQRGYLRVAVFAGAVLLMGLSLTGLSFSFVGNRHLINASVTAFEGLKEMDLRKRAFVDHMFTMERLRVRLDQIMAYEEGGPPLRLRGGLYQGSKLYNPLGEIYYQRFAEIMILPAKSVVEVDLEGFVSNPSSLPEGRDVEDYYSFLKAYLMMSDPSRLDHKFLEPWLKEIWNILLIIEFNGEKKIPEGLQDIVNKQIEFYTRYAGKDSAPLLKMDDRLVADVRRVLQQIPIEERLYARIRREAIKEVKAYSIHSIMNGRSQTSLVSDYEIPGVFTIDEGQDAFQGSMALVLESSGQEEWVLGIPEPEAEDLQQEVQKLYFKDYLREWRRFVESTQIHTGQTLSETERAIALLIDENSPLIKFLSEVSRQTNLQPKSMMDPEGLTSAIVQRVKKSLRIKSRSGEESTSTRSDPVTSGFRSIHEFVAPSGDEKGEASLVKYIGELGMVRETARGALASEGGAETTVALSRQIVTAQTNDLVQGLKKTEQLLNQLDPISRRLMGPLLLSPIRASLTGVMLRAREELDRRWRSEVYEPCIRSISGRYPFKRGGEDATLLDLSDFFHPEQGVLWQFYQEELQAYIQEERKSWKVKKVAGAWLPVNDSFLETLYQARSISDALFPRGSADLEVPFSLYPYPSAGVSQINFKMNGVPIRYRMGPQEWHKMTWPGSSERAGASLQVVLRDGVRQTRQFPGLWGLFRLIDEAKFTRKSNTQYQLEWNFKMQAQKVLKVRFDLKPNSYKNPFQPGMFGKFTCPRGLA